MFTQKFNELFLRYLVFFKFSNEKPKNKELLFDYISKQFSDSPQIFYRFLKFYKQSLLHESDVQIKRKLAEQYLEVLSLFSSKFNFFKEKNDLDDLCFKICNPEQYQEIYSLLHQYQKKSRRLIQKILTLLEQTLKGKCKIIKIEGRYKNLYSIYKKLGKSYNKNALNLNDIFAFRIILKNKNENQCFDALNLLHDRFEPVVDFFRDYISIPKINGYQSLHTGLRNNAFGIDLPIEVQIRTESMHQFAQNGLAAHWLYAKQKKSRLISIKEKKLLQQYSNIEEVSNKEQFVYFLSYEGDIIKIEKNHSILDFAYQIHTDLGHRAIGALVNGNKTPLHYIIQEGDRIQILLSNENQVCESRMAYVKSKNALRRISESLRRKQDIHFEFQR